LADQRVARVLSTALAGTLPSFVLAVTAEAPGVTSTDEADGANTLTSATLFQGLVPPALSVAPCPT
jgi:hypothetical protein